MGAGDVKFLYRGLCHEPHGAGMRWRVRVEGQPSRKITIPVGPDHDDFLRHYKAARAGERIDAPPPPPPAGTMAALFAKYLADLEKSVKAGSASPLTLKERRNLAEYVLSQRSEQRRTHGLEYRGLPASIPPVELEAFKDRMRDKPGKARNVWKLLIAAYDFGKRRGMVTTNPARAVDRPAYVSGGGAVPWTLDDLAAYRKAHPPGTMAHLCLTLFTFTACRIGDAYRIGRGNEVRHGGALWLEWQPAKRGSSPVSIPVMPPLERAIRAQTVIGATYLLTGHGKPFASPEGLRNAFRKWCDTAGLEGRSSHGIRKAAGHLLALHGASQYEIMAIHGHANATTSEVYTRGVERRRLGEMAASRLAGLDW